AQPAPQPHTRHARRDLTAAARTGCKRAGKCAKMYITYAYSKAEQRVETVSERVIELNGKRYDAVTGAYLGKSHVIPKHITDRHVHGKVIDGFMLPQPAKKAPEPKAATKETKK